MCALIPTRLAELESVYFACCSLYAEHIGSDDVVCASVVCTCASSASAGRLAFCGGFRYHTLCWLALHLRIGPVATDGRTRSRVL